MTQLINIISSKTQIPATNYNTTNKPETKPNADINTNTSKTNDDGKKAKIIYVSKNPNAVVNATGVVAGTAGMIGGAVLGGSIGTIKLAPEFLKTIINQDYPQKITTILNDFSQSISTNPALKQLVETIQNTNSQNITEEFIASSETIMSRLNSTFKDDKIAKSVIDDVIDPIVKAVSLKENFRSYSNIGKNLALKDAKTQAKGIKLLKTPAGESILKFLGLNMNTSRIIGNITGNIVTGLSQATINIKNFSPEQKEAWGKICAQIFEDLTNNPEIKTSKEVLKSLKEITTNFDWILKPLENLERNIKTTINDISKSITLTPLKTIGKYSAIGAVSCATISILGWLGLKKTLMTKETNLAELNKN